MEGREEGKERTDAWFRSRAARELDGDGGGKEKRGGHVSQLESGGGTGRVSRLRSDGCGEILLLESRDTIYNLMK